MIRYESILHYVGTPYSMAVVGWAQDGRSGAVTRGPERVVASYWTTDADSGALVLPSVHTST